MVVPWIVIDFETSSGCDLKKAGSYRYAADPTTAILCLSAENYRGERATWFPGEELPAIVAEALLNGRYMFVCHNAAFERNIWTQIMVAEFGFDEIPISQWHDTQARGCSTAMPASLEKLLQALGGPMEKDTEGNRLTLSLSRPDPKTGMLPTVTPAILARVGTYCESDIEGQTWLHKRLGWLDAHERPIWELACEVNDRGIMLDMDFVRGAQRVVDRATGPLALEFRKITGLNFGQTAKVKAWVNEQGVPLDNLQAETIDKLLGPDEGEGDEDENSGEAEWADWDLPESAHYQIPAHVRRALSIRRLVGSSSIKKLARMVGCVGYDGRARGLLRYHGTTPGRQTASLFQPHNFPRGTLKKMKDAGEEKLRISNLIEAVKTGDPVHVAAVSGRPAVETIVGSLRHAMCAAPGRVFIAGDYAGIQARTVLALAGQYDKCDLLAAGMDIYCDMAGQIYKRVITKADVEERQTGKNSVLGLGFQMGANKFWWKYCPEMTFAFAEQVVKVYRLEWAPLVPKLWNGLSDAAVDTVWSGSAHEFNGVLYRCEDAWLTATIPNGSKIWYYNPQPVTRRMPWSTDEDPDYRKSFTYQVEKNKHLITRDAFGGQLTENIVMKIEREIMEHAKRKLNDNGFPVVLDVHDEILCEPEENNCDVKAFVQMMEDVEPWVRDYRIPVAVEEWVSPVYRK